MMYGAGSTPGSFPNRPATPVTTRTTEIQAAMRRSKPCANKSNVSGPGAMKKVQIQIGQ
jgi:hypothetical protein